MPLSDHSDGWWFAWVDPGTPWSTDLMRDDERVYHASINHREGEAPTMQCVIKNPRVGLLSVGRKRWAWMTRYNRLNGHPEALFYGRLLAYPTNVQQERITLNFSAEPTDLLTQQRALVEPLKVRPNYDPVFTDISRRQDPKTVLEGYSALFHIGRTDQTVSISDIVVGEAGDLVFLESDAFYDSVETHLGRAPLKGVVVNANVAWQRIGTGLIDMGTQAFSNFTGDGFIDEWPKPYADLGGGWSVYSSKVVDLLQIARMEMASFSSHYQNEAKTHVFGDTMTIDTSDSRPLPWRGGYYAQTSFHEEITIGDYLQGIPARTHSEGTDVWIPLWNVQAELILRYDIQQDRSETVRFTLVADVQTSYTDSGDVAQDFAQDYEFLELQGNVGLEVPFGTYRGTWAASTQYFQYDYFTVTIDGLQVGYQVTRDHMSLSSFDPLATATLWQPFTLYRESDNVFAGGTYYTVKVTHTSAGSFDPAAIDPNTAELIYIEILDPHAGTNLYQEMSGFRGPWQSGTAYIAGEIFVIGSPPTPAFYKVLIGHTSAGSFDPLAIDVRGQLLYGFLINPPPIGNSAARSYFPTDRGLWSIEYLMCVARAHLLERARNFQVTFKVALDKATSISCRHNATLFDPHMPGGQVTGKVIEYSFEVDGESGLEIATITIACCTGNGSHLAGSLGTPTYVNDGYFDPGEVQYYSDAVILTGPDMGYTPPIDGPEGDDGLTYPLSKGEVVVSEGLITLNNQQAQVRALDMAYKPPVLQEIFPYGLPVITQGVSNNVWPRYGQAAFLAYQQALITTPVMYNLVLKPVQNGPFSREWDITTTQLKVPMQINLSAT